MTNNILAQSVIENSNGVEKGSSKRIIAYLLAITFIFLCVYPIIKGQTPPLELIGIVGGYLTALLGISAYHATINKPEPIVPAAAEKKSENQVL